MHHSYLVRCCLDIDGVLCRDPTTQENDDGQQYISFLQSAERIFTPQRPVGYLVTSRLEKYRPETEQWLRRHNMQYKQLFMLDLPTREARIKMKAHAEFKSEVYSKTNAQLFIESSYRQAREIALRTGKPVLCLETWSMMPTGLTPLFGHAIYALLVGSCSGN